MAVAVGTLLVVVHLAAFPTAAPHDLPVGVTGPAAEVDAVRQAVDEARPGAVRFVGLRDPGAAERAVASGDVHGALVLGPPGPALLVAGAHGQAVTQDLTEVLVPAVSARTGAPPTVTDLAPLAAGDQRGRAIDHLAFGVVLGGFLFGITSYQVAPRQRLGLRLLSAVLFATAAGLAGALLAGPGSDAVPAPSWPVAGLVGLLALACGCAAALALRLLGGAGTFVATAVLLTVGAATSTARQLPRRVPARPARAARVRPAARRGGAGPARPGPPRRRRRGARRVGARAVVHRPGAAHRAGRRRRPPPLTPSSCAGPLTPSGELI
ncbi:hypothetical protein [Geodermatophilus sp. SYSU D01036]